MRKYSYIERSAISSRIDRISRRKKNDSEFSGDGVAKNKDLTYIKKQDKIVAKIIHTIEYGVFK